MQDRTPIDSIVLELAEEVRDELAGVLPDLGELVERAGALLSAITWREEEGEAAPEVVEELLAPLRGLSRRLHDVGAYAG